MNDAILSGGLERHTLRGITIELWRRGEGTPLVFLHPGDGFAPDDAFLTSLSRNHAVIAPWHPGFGATDLPQGWNTVDDLAYFYLDLLEDLDLARATLVGASFGGWIAAEMAVRDDRRIGHLILIDPLGIKVGDRTTRDIADFQGTEAGALDRMIWANPDRPRQNLHDLDDESLRRIVRSREAFAHFGWRPYMHNPVLGRWLHRISVPTLVLWGERDRIVTPEYGRAYAARIPGARFAPIPDAGHYPHIEQPQTCLKLVRAFVDG